MTLHFLDLDYSEDADGIATWDAMACVQPGRLPALLAEVESILGWALANFAAEQGPHEDGGLWQYDLQCERDGQPLVELRLDPQTGRIAAPTDLAAGQALTLNLSLSGSGAFAEAFAARFPEPG